MKIPPRLCGDPQHTDWRKAEIGPHTTPPDHAGRYGMTPADICTFEATGVVQIVRRP